MNAREQSIEMHAVAFTDGLLAGECLPPADGEVDKSGFDLDRQADSIAGLGSDQRRAATQEGLIHRLARSRIIQHRSPHAFDRLLGRVLRLSILTVTRDAPE